MSETPKHPHIDPTLPRVELKVGAEIYLLCFTYAALTIAESELRKIGHPANLLHALDFESLDASTLVSLLYAALITHQPETKLENVPSLIKFRNIGKIREALMTAFVASIAEPEEGSDPLA